MQERNTFTDKYERTNQVLINLVLKLVKSPNPVVNPKHQGKAQNDRSKKKKNNIIITHAIM